MLHFGFKVWELHTQHRHILLPPNRKLADRPPRVTQVSNLRFSVLYIYVMLFLLCWKYSRLEDVEYATAVPTGQI